jgi:hypothetical protein
MILFQASESATFSNGGTLMLCSIAISSWSLNHFKSAKSISAFLANVLKSLSVYVFHHFHEITVPSCHHSALFWASNNCSHSSSVNLLNGLDTAGAHSVTSLL